tara:strand:- start:350 stop:643 length:294 start_codon:yes stop_codon:yes gene_type:complete
MFPSPENVTNTIEAFSYINDLTSSSFFGGIILVVFFISMVNLKNFETPKALAFSSFFCGLLSTFAWLMGFASKTFLLIFAVLMGVSLIWLHAENSKY